MVVEHVTVTPIEVMETSMTIQSTCLQEVLKYGSISVREAGLPWTPLVAPDEEVP